MTGGFSWYLPRLRGRYLARQSVVGALPFCCRPECLILGGGVDFWGNDGNFHPDFHPGSYQRIADVVMHANEA